MRTMFSRHGRKLHRGRTMARRVHRPSVERLDDRCLLDAGMGYVQTNLASDIPGLAPNNNPQLINPWGFSETPDGQFRVAANGSGTAILFDAQGAKTAPDIKIPLPPSSSPSGTSAPNGVISNPTSGFVISDHGRSAPATLLFSTEDGTIAGWNPAVDQTQAVIAADQSGNGAVYKLLTMGTIGQQSFVYATDLHNNAVDVFDSNFHLVNLGPNAFVDPTTGKNAIPSNFAPFGIKNVGGTLFVTYAMQDAAKHDDVAGVGNGFIDEYDTSGNFIKRFATRGTLNSPIGATFAPADFGPFSNDLLIGNFGDSKVNAFDPVTGKFLGQLKDPQGNPLILNGGFQETDTKGLWGIGFGNGAGGAATNAMFFADGINQENDGLFGKVTFAGSAMSPSGSEDSQGQAVTPAVTHNSAMLIPLVVDDLMAHKDKRS
jgi:uncharacterized protein (TIGR03118 family)